MRRPNEIPRPITLGELIAQAGVFIALEAGRAFGTMRLRVGIEFGRRPAFDWKVVCRRID